MRKVRDYDAELKALDEKAKLLRQRRILQFGELVEATGAGVLDPDRLAGALLAAASEKNEAAIANWTSSGARFFRESSRRSSRRASASSKGSNAPSTGASPS